MLAPDANPIDFKALGKTHRIDPASPAGFGQVPADRQIEDQMERLVEWRTGLARAAAEPFASAAHRVDPAIDQPADLLRLPIHREYMKAFQNLRIMHFGAGAHERRPWNAGSFVGAKRPLKPRDVWAIRFYLNEHRRLRDCALFDLAIDSKLRGCDVVKMKIGDVVASGSVRNRATIIRQKTNRPVQFELMADARSSLLSLAGATQGIARRLLVS